MKQIKTTGNKERQTYVPAKIKVIDVTARQQVLIGSLPPGLLLNGTETFEREEW